MRKPIVSPLVPRSSEHSGMETRHRLIKLFWTLGPAFTRWAESHMHEHGLTAQRMRLMGLLIEQGDMMMSQLRNELGVTATNVTALVDALEKDGLVVRKNHPTDRRATMISITPAMEKCLSEDCALFKDKVAEIFSDFTDTEQEQFLHLLLRMREALVKRNFLVPSESCSKISPAEPTS